MKFVILSLALGVCAATKIGDMSQGEEFTKCISLTDFESKGLADDITLSDRDDNGCCTGESVPGAKYYTAYQGAQVVCGFDSSDGSVSGFTSSTSNGVTTCDYGSCYVMKQGSDATGITCSDDSKQLLNGCCGPTEDARLFTDTCKDYDYTFYLTNSDGDSISAEYCLTYNEDYSMEGTSATTDDIDSDVLQVANLYTYTPCESMSGDGSGTDDTSGSSISCNVGTAVTYSGCSGWTDSDTFTETSCASGYDACYAYGYEYTLSGCTTTTITGACWDEVSAEAYCDAYLDSWGDVSGYSDVTCTACTTDNCNPTSVGGGVVASGASSNFKIGAVVSMLSFALVALSLA